MEDHWNIVDEIRSYELNRRVTDYKSFATSYLYWSELKLYQYEHCIDMKTYIENLTYKYEYIHSHRQLMEKYIGKCEDKTQYNYPLPTAAQTVHLDQTSNYTNVPTAYSTSHNSSHNSIGTTSPNPNPNPLHPLDDRIGFSCNSILLTSEHHIYHNLTLLLNGIAEEITLLLAEYEALCTQYRTSWR